MSLYRLALIALLTLSLLNPLVIAGGIVVDGSNGHKATMDTTANGLPLINIATPNGSGLSHNQFSTFNIAPSGVVFNNALKATQTQLGGWVQGNANLGVTPARVILNEVTGTSRSLLQGYGEVAGAAADVIIANPNGITVNGGGFINTPHATLTTGVPDVTNGNLNGFTVQRGDVLIEGSGFNGTNIDRVDLYTKALQLNGNMYASTLNVVTGSNHITPEGVITPLNMIPQTGVSIDSSALGGIYANTIVLVGSDKGVGVNLPQITYASNSLHLSADGHITLGSVCATNSMTITSQSNDITLTHELSTADVTLNASKGITNLGSLTAQTGSLQSNHLTNTTNATMEIGTVNMVLSGDLTNQGKLILPNSHIHTGSMTNQGTLVSDTAFILTDQTLTNTGTLHAKMLTLEGNNIINNALFQGDSTTTITTTHSLTNNGGIIGGDHLTLKSDTLTNNQVLYSGQAIDLSATTTLRNTQGSQILSAGSLSIHDTGTVSNEAATIQAQTTMSIHATNLENLSSTIPTKTTTASNIGVCDYFAPDYRDWKNTSTTIETIDKGNYLPAMILSGGDMHLEGAIHNRYSLIAANGNMTLSGSLNNEASVDAHQIIDISHYVEHWEKHSRFGGEAWYYNYGYYEHYDTLPDHVYSTIQATGTINGTFTTLSNGNFQGGASITSLTSPAMGLSPVILPQGNYGVFINVTNPALPYRIESNPLYTNYDTFIGSDYIMSRLNLNVSDRIKRLGDARYETQLVSDAVFKLSGQHTLEGYGNDTAQYQGLMDNALALHDALNLKFGIALSSDQIASLDRDIVWMETKVVAGQSVLVPVVYLAPKNQTLTPGGRIIAGGDLTLNANEGITNGGELKATHDLTLNASHLTNTGGTIQSSGDLTLHTTKDITNTSGTLEGNNVSLTSDEGSILSQRSSSDFTVNPYAGTSGSLGLLGDNAMITARSNLTLNAHNDLTLMGTTASSQGTMGLSGNTITLSSQAQNSHTTTVWEHGSSEFQTTTNHLSSLNAGGNLTLNAAHDLRITSANLTTAQDLTLKAGDAVVLTANNDVTYSDIQNHSHSLLSSHSQEDQNLHESVIGSTLSGNNITITSGEDTTLQAANLTADNTLSVKAGGDINVVAKTYREAHLHQESSSSLGGLKSASSLDSTDAIKLHEATVKTKAKNIIMNSGKDINIIASEVNSAADVQLTAFENLNIIAGEESKSEKHESQKSSFNPLGILNLVGIDAGSLYTQDIHTKDNYDTTAKSSSITAGGNITADTGTTNIIGSHLNARDDVTITADIGGINVATAQELHNASTLDKHEEVKLTNLFDSVNDATTNLTNGKDSKLKFNVASATLDETTTSAQGVHNVGSSITSGKNVTLDSSDDIAIKGSNVTAQETIDLKSKTGNIAITESVDTTNTTTQAKHASAEINLVVQNEYVQTAVAVDNALKATQQLQQTKEDYRNYKREVKNLEATLDSLQTDYKNNIPGVDYSDIEDLKEVISTTKENEHYYLAAITLATANVASKTAAIASQGAAAAASSGTLGFNAGISFDVTESKTSTDTSATHANASNLSASNIIMTTDTTADTSVTLSGSNVTATDTLTLNTHDLNVQASHDTTTQNRDSKDISGSITMSVYGGGALGASLGYGENHATHESETNHNANLNANTMNITTSKDATFQGATVRADDTLNLTIGNNLNVESVRDSSSSASHGMNASVGISAATDFVNFPMSLDGMNASVGISVGGNNTSLSGANASIGSTKSQSSEKQTILTSLTGNNVTITVGENTNLKGSLIAAGSTDENEIFHDNHHLNLSTKTLTFENTTNTQSSNSQGLGIGTGVNPQGDISSLSAQLSTGMTYERTKTLATLGTGTITITDTTNSDDLSRRNTDTTHINTSLFKTDTGTSVSGTLDTRLLSAEGRKEIKNQNKELAGNVINGVAFAGNVITGNMNVDNAIASFQDPYKMAEAIKNNPELAATLDAFTKGEFDNLPKTKEGLQTLADATGLKVDILLTTVTNYLDAKGATDKKLIALDVNEQNRENIAATLGHEVPHVRGSTNETLADMSGYATQLLSEVAIDSYDATLLNSLKLELGTGQDDATQIANQVLLANDNQTFLDAYNDHQLEFYFERDDNPQLNIFYGNHEGTWNGKFSANFIKKTNKNLGKYVTLIKTDETELTMLAIEDYENFLWFSLGGELGIGKVELPKFKFITDENGIKIEAGIGIKTIDGRSGFEVKNFFNSNFSIKGGFTGSLGGIGASGSLNANKKKIGLNGELTYGVGAGGNLEVTRDK